MDDDSLKKLKYDEQRKKRVKRIKRTIIIVVMALIIIPIIMCIFLAIRVKSLQEQIDFLYEARYMDIMNARYEKRINGGTDSLEYLSEKEDEAEVKETVEQTSNEAPDEGTEGIHKIYLTFDDGPSENTAQILDILKEYDIKATFFVVGKEGEEYEQLYKRIVDEGHTLGMHSYSHQYSSVYNSLDTFKEDFHKIQDLLYNVTGYKPMIYRFPGGSNNKVSNTDVKELIEFLKSEGVEYYDWNASNGDAASKEYTVQELINNVVTSISDDKNQSIVLMHDTNTKGKTVEALGPVIDKLKEMGLSILPIGSDTEPIHLLKTDE